MSETGRFEPVSVTALEPYSQTAIQSIKPNVVGQNLSRNIHASLIGLTWPFVASNFDGAARTTNLGLAAAVNSAQFTTISSIHSINGERMIDEVRELAGLNELLGNTILQCCYLETYIRAQQAQIHQLEGQENQNAEDMKKIFQAEIDRLKEILDTKYANKSTLKSQVRELEENIVKNEGHYQHLLTKHNALEQEMSDFEHKIAQNKSEIHFLTRRVRQLDDNTKFYILKNQALDARKARLQYELDEDTFSYQSLTLEAELIQKEKITREDVQNSALDDTRNTVNTSQMISGLLSKSYRDELNKEVQRMKNDHEKKIESLREELHRRYELALHRYQVERASIVPTPKKEYEVQLDQYMKEKQDIIQQLAAVRGQCQVLDEQIQATYEKIRDEQRSARLNTSQEETLMQVNGIIRSRERQLEEAMRYRRSLKEQIDVFKEQMNVQSLSPHRSISPRPQSVSSFSQENSPFLARSSREEVIYQDRSTESNTHRSKSMPSRDQSDSRISTAIPWNVFQVKEVSESGTLVGVQNFQVEQDVNELNRVLGEVNPDEIEVIRIICNRNVQQRVAINQRFRLNTGQDLRQRLRYIDNQSLRNLLNNLLLSPVEYDCYELRRELTDQINESTILVEIVFARSQDHIQAIFRTYRNLFDTKLETSILGDRRKQSGEILLFLLQSERPEKTEIDNNLAVRDAQELHESTTGWTSTDSVFVRLLSSRSNPQLKHTFNCYYQLYNVDIERAVEMNTQGSMRRLYLSIVQIIRNRPKFFAQELGYSLQDAVRNEEQINRYIVTRCEVDMVQIKSEYEKINKRTFYTHIQTELTGNYKIAILELIRQRMPPKENENERTYAINTGPKDIVWRNSTPSNASGTYSHRSFTRNGPMSTFNRTSRYDSYKSTQRTASNGLTYSKINNPSTNTTAPKLQFNPRRTIIPVSTIEENIVLTEHNGS